MPSSEYKKYLQVIQSKQKTNSNLLNQVVSEATGSIPVSQKRIFAGEINEVYDVVLKNGDSVITRINLSDNPTFFQEKWAIDRCIECDIPVPRIISIKHIPQDNKVLSFCLQEKLPGTTLGLGTEINRVDKSLLTTLIFKSGEFLSKMHQISVVGFGHLDGSGHGTHSNFEEVMSEKFKNPDKYLQLSNRVNISRKEILSCLSFIEKTIPEVSKLRPFMVHGDFGPKHIMFENGEITGILDFGDVLGHSPIFDLARWEYFYGDNKNFQILKNGYSDKKIFDNNYGKISKLIQLDMGLSVLLWYTDQNYKEGINKNIQKIKEVLSGNGE